MKLTSAIWISGLSGLTAACADAKPIAPTDARPLVLDTGTRADLRAQSCPAEASFLLATSIDIDAEPFELMPQDWSRPVLAEGVSFRAGWVLSSDHSPFGGLSGVEATAGGNLVFVSDAGGFVWISMDGEAEGFRPLSARMADMRGADGRLLTGKSEGDAEDIALTADGMALVSFERDHRVLAFDLEGCGAAALGVEIGAWPGRVAGVAREINENTGAEGLALLEDGRVAVALEANDGNSPYGLLPASGAPDFSARLETPGLLSTVGLDAAGDLLFSVHRFYAPGIGNRIAVEVSELGPDGFPGPATQIVSIEPPMRVDNVEGISVLALGEGRFRLFLISDDNFSGRQDTLLYVFDYAR